MRASMRAVVAVVILTSPALQGQVRYARPEPRIGVSLDDLAAVVPVTVFQVVSDRAALVKFHTVPELLVWMEGDMTGLADGSRLDREALDRIAGVRQLVVTGTRRYTNLLGGSTTLFVVTPGVSLVEQRKAEAEARAAAIVRQREREVEQERERERQRILAGERQEKQVREQREVDARQGAAYAWDLLGRGLRGPAQAQARQVVARYPGTVGAKRARQLLDLK